MAGNNTGFDPAAFRTGIKFAMQMGAPNSVSDRVTFVWRPAKTFSKTDPAGNPYDWSASPTTTETHADVVVDVAVTDLGRPTPEHTAVGAIDAQKISLTLLDVDYEQVVGAQEVRWGGKTFQIDYVMPPIALFSVDIHTIFATAVDL